MAGGGGGEGYRMVFANICKYARNAFIFALTSSDQFSRGSSKHLEITNSKQRALRNFSATWNLLLLKRCFAPSNLADTFKTGQQAQS